jgi:hypothetical protein
MPFLISELVELGLLPLQFFLHPPLTISLNFLIDLVRINSQLHGVFQCLLQFSQLLIDAFALGFISLHFFLHLLYLQPAYLLFYFFLRQMNFFNHQLYNTTTIPFE